jgi:hypothetical protein
MNALARRVVRRHQATVVFRDVPYSRIEYSDGARVTAVELARMLEPTTGPLTKLRFRSSITGTPNTIAWEALDEDADMVSGKLIIHARVSDTEVVTWAEVEVHSTRSEARR